MKLFYFLTMLAICGVSLMLSCARGTEVGNGNRPDDTTAPVSNKTESDKSDPQTDAGVPTKNSSDGPELVIPSPLHWLLAPCASPLREAGNQSLIYQDLTINVSNTNGEQRSVRVQEQEFTVVPDIEKGNFAVKINPSQSDYTYTCSQLDNGSESAERRNFRIVINDETKADVSWDLNNLENMIENLSIQTDNGQLIEFD